ncbi:MAG: hypothetical protein ABIT96_09255 [Ferruginibacter sp.]
MLKAKFSVSLYITCLLFLSGTAFAQPTWTIDPFGREKKPEQYEDKILGSEKTADKKFTFFRRFVQNNVTHYNYYFNASNKLAAVIDRAKASQQDDYSKLLSFFPYSLENTSAQQTELDSVIYKATAGILLHDLRSDWVDNMYLLIGKSYYLRNELDSAALTFQFINYNLFPRKRKNDDDSRIIGTNDEPGSKALSIADKENRNFIDKAFTLPPSRNDALIWLARTFTAQGEYADAAGLINILKLDPNLPKRLQNDLEALNAYWFYAQNMYDSSAVHLANALSAADTKQDQSRWEYLVAQMYEITGAYEKASDYYALVSRHTVDPVMDIYARLNDAKMMRDEGNMKELESSISTLLRMARRDKYESYRDIIYYSAAQLNMQRPDTTGSLIYYAQSVSANTGNTLYKNRAFYQLANITYSQGRYREASAFYDSLSLNDDLDIPDSLLDKRKAILTKLVGRVEAIDREDSLQRVAAMLPADREAYIKNLIRKYRKAQGLKEEDFAGNTLITFNNSNNTPQDLFPGSSKGEWYFYNNNLRSRGLNDFKNKWGKRTNTDNWRRKAATVTMADNNNLANNIDIDALPTKLTSDGKQVAMPVSYTYDDMVASLPLSPVAMDSSNQVIAENLLALAKIFQDDLEDYPKAINAYDDYLTRFAQYSGVPEAYFGLYYSYTRLGNTSKAAYYKNLLATKYTGNKYSNMLVNPSAENPMMKTQEVTDRYTSIYNMYIEGNFREAYAAKQAADSTYGKNYWSPQLLYIESVQHIKDREDSLAIVSLNNLKSMYPANPLAAKAATMIDVLGRRSQIESYLDSIQVTRQEETLVIVADEKPAVRNIDVKPSAPVVKKMEPTIVAPRAARDSVKAPAIFMNEEFTWSPNQSQYVIMILDKVDGVYINEAKNAFARFNRENYLYQNVAINRDTIDAQRVILVFTPFADGEAAIKYFDKIKKAAPAEVSWLPANKYSFLVISEDNLRLLKSNKKLDVYRQLLKNNFSNKF